MSDLLAWPVVGAILRWRHLRTATRAVLLLVAAALVAHGLFGPQFAPTNLATLATWIHYRGLLIGVLIVAGNAFCHACPMILARDLTRRVHAPTLGWPGRLHGKWLALPLFAAVLFAYEAFDLWAQPAATAWLIVGYFAGAIIVDTLFKGAAFCKHVCPVGQFNFVASTVSPLEIRARDGAVCAGCRTFDCLKGRRAPEAPAIVVQRGCELHLFVPTKVGNLECTFCLDCVQACPHDNVALATRVPGEELTDDRRRSLIGRLSRRPDFAALALLFTFGALLNAFAMTAPLQALERWFAIGTGATSEGSVLAVLFVLALGVAPLGLCAGAAAITHLVGGARATFTPVKTIAVSYAYALVPIGCAVWFAHYAFHFLTGIGTIVPVTQSAAIDALGWAILGEPAWGWLGLRAGIVFPLQVGAILLGGFGSTSLIHRISERDYRGHAAEAGAPWVVIAVGLTVLALWILAQPMDMRGTGFLS
jgi:polyferredoxin